MQNHSQEGYYDALIYFSSCEENIYRLNIQYEFSIQAIDSEY